MKGTFIEGADLELGIKLVPEDDNERLLLRCFSQQAEKHGDVIYIRGWGLGGDRPGFRELRLHFAKDGGL